MQICRENKFLQLLIRLKSSVRKFIRRSNGSAAGSRELLGGSPHRRHPCSALGMQIKPPACTGDQQIDVPLSEWLSCCCIPCMLNIPATYPAPRKSFKMLARKTFRTPEKLLWRTDNSRSYQRTSSAEHLLRITTRRVNNEICEQRGSWAFPISMMSSGMSFPIFYKWLSTILGAMYRLLTGH
jgi:hypothetical protein